MTIADLQEFRDALSRYNSNVGGFYAKEKVERVNKAIANINLDGIEDLFAEADVHEHDVCDFVSSLHNSIQNILREVERQEWIIESAMDANVDKVAFFAEQVVEKLEITLNTLKTRRETEPTNEDKSALKYLNGYIAGDYGNIPFDKFISGRIMRGLKGVALRRRINYLISQCKDEQINKSLLEHLNKVDKEHCADGVNNTNQQVETISPAPTDTPDFAHMRSFTPIMPFDVDALYDFLIDEQVIKGIGKQLFSNCIEHAYIAPLWGNCTRYKIKLVMHHLKNYFKKTWFDAICESVGLSRDAMGGFNNSGRRDLEQKLLDILKRR